MLDNVTPFKTEYKANMRVAVNAEILLMDALKPITRPISAKKSTKIVHPLLKSAYNIA